MAGTPWVWQQSDEPPASPSPSTYRAGKGWIEGFGEDDWSQSRYTWARGYHGVYAHLSSNGGHTFEHTAKLDTTPYRDGYTRTGVTELSDGRIAYAITEHHPPHNRHTYILLSDNGGLTWSSPVLIADTPELCFSEPDMIEVKPGELYCILRDSRRTRYLHGRRSLDGGWTWSTPKRTSMYGHPGHLLVLHDGRLLCIHGRREASFGIRACLSEDGGRTWQIDCEIINRDDLPNSDPVLLC